MLNIFSYESLQRKFKVHKILKYWKAFLTGAYSQFLIWIQVPNSQLLVKTRVWKEPPPTPLPGCQFTSTPLPNSTHCAAIVQWFVPLVRNHKVTGSNPIPVRFESNVSALSELSINCTMAWVADRQVRAMLYATLAVS